MEEKFYTINEVAELLDMHHKTIRKFITEGSLKANKLGKQWRISEHDLNSFMKVNRNEDIDENQGLDFSISEPPSNIKKARINVSTVIDIEEINKEQYMRISNTLIAIMNCKDAKMNNSTINMKYYEEENKLRVLLWGQIKFIEEMLSTVSMLVEPQTKDK
ncbi:helix-turn-helix domain-containing protein [Clostridium neuense]|uniref:Helix-turn-helix domain-containing protein n=1 Tax=Clostridium neuense TaxID=1728934 RepID=A0ABW8TG66_9CLOT